MFARFPVVTGTKKGGAHVAATLFFRPVEYPAAMYGRSADPAAPHKIDDPEQDHRADEGREQGHRIECVTAQMSATQEGAKQKAAPLRAGKTGAAA